MLAVDAIVSCAPNDYGTPNALAHAGFERTLCFRHRETFSLAGTLGIAVTVDGRHEDSPVLSLVCKMMGSNLMPFVDTVRAEGVSQCHGCGHGESCAVGSVVGKHGFLDCIKEEYRPAPFAEPEASAGQAAKVGKILGSILRARL